MPSLITKALKVLIVLIIPIFIAGGAIQLLATDQYLTFEYYKANFPPDPHGFTSQQRLDLASIDVHYVLAHLPDNTLSKETLDGAPVYNPRLVSHMADVRAAFQSGLEIWHATIALLVFAVLILWIKEERKALATAAQWGGLLAGGMVVFIAFPAHFDWRFWFDKFNQLLFKPCSCLSSYADTLLRLFPTQFWFDTTLMISALSLIGGLLLAFVGWRWHIQLERTGRD